MSLLKRVMEVIARRKSGRTSGGSMLEPLEGRQLLSGHGAEPDLLDAAPAAAVVMPLHATAKSVRATKAATMQLRGTYVGTYSDSEGYSAELIFRVLKQQGTKITARMYTADLGGFDVTGTGTLKSAQVIYGMTSSETLQKGKINARVSADGRRINGSLSATVMGFASKGRITLEKTAKAVPAKLKVKAPAMKRSYSGIFGTSGYSEKLTMAITKQVGGQIWGWGKPASGGQFTVTGTVMPDGRFRLIGRDGKTIAKLYGEKSGRTLEGYLYVSGDDSGTYYFSVK